MEALGVQSEQLTLDARQAPGSADSEEHVRVAPHLAQAVDVFANLRSQWLTASAGMGGFVYLGINHTAIESTLRLMEAKVPDLPQLFRWLKVMETAAKPVMNGD